MRPRCFWVLPLALLYLLFYYCLYAKGLSLFFSLSRVLSSRSRLHSDRRVGSGIVLASILQISAQFVAIFGGFGSIEVRVEFLFYHVRLACNTLGRNFSIYWLMLKERILGKLYHRGPNCISTQASFLRSKHLEDLAI